MHFAGMTLTIRDDARREIQADVDALTRSPKYFNIKAERAKTYFPIIEKVFEEERLPLDFKYLALQESALIPDAVSTSNAVGFWQFKDFTATEMGMRVDQEVDERMNIASSSRGAARYLKQCNHYFNNWIYALQSYQMGAGGVMRAVGDKDLGSRHMEINADTYWYVKKFLAHKVAFEQVSGKPALEITVVSDAAGKTLGELAREASVEESALLEVNKWLKTDRIPEDKPYVVIIPRGTMAPEFNTLTVAAAAKTAPAVQPAAKSSEPREVNGVPVIQAKAGEGLTDLVARADISLSRFLNYNEMDIDQPVRTGAWYFLDKKKKHASQDVYTVSPGESLWEVSQRFGVRMKYLMKYNDLDKETVNLEGSPIYLSFHKPSGTVSESDSTIALLDTGDTFEWDVSLAPTRKTTLSASSGGGTGKPVAADIPAPESYRSATSTTTYHEVKASDTLYSVARQYGVTIREIMEWNGKKDFNLSVGEKLRVAGR